MAANRFRSHFGGRVTFQCDCCKRNTRMTTQSDDRYCGECEELLGIQNALWDDGAEVFIADGAVPYRDKLLAKIVKLKGSESAVRAYMPDLFAVSASA